jgi:hypothetical protein
VTTGPAATATGAAASGTTITAASPYDIGRPHHSGIDAGTIAAGTTRATGTGEPAGS